MEKNVYNRFLESVIYMLNKYKETSSETSTSDNQELVDSITKHITESVISDHENIISSIPIPIPIPTPIQADNGALAELCAMNAEERSSVEFPTIDILNDDYKLEKNNDPFIFNQASQGLYYNWSSSVSCDYVCYTYSPGTTFIINKLTNPDAELQPSQVLIFDKHDINDKIQKEPLYKIVLPKFIEGIRSSLIIEDDSSNPFVLLGTFSYPQQGRITNSYLLKWYFKSNILEKILLFENDNSIRKIIRHVTSRSDYIYLSTQNDLDPKITSKIYKIATDNIVYFNSIEKMQKYLKTYILVDNINPIFGSVWDFEIDQDENIFISIPQQNIDETKLSGFSTKGRLYYNKLCFFGDNTYVTVISLIGNNYYPSGFNEPAISTFQTQSNGTNQLIIYSLSDFLYQFLAILPKLNLLFQDVNSINDLKSIEELILNIRALFKNVDIDGFKVLYLNKDDLYNNKYPPITCLIGEPPINTINKSVAGNGNNNMYNVYAWQSTFDKENKNIYIGSLDLGASIYDSLIGLVQNTYPLLYIILKNLPEDIKILILYILIEKPTLPINFYDKKFYFDVIELNHMNQIKTITTDGFKKAKKNLLDEGVRTISIIKNENGKFLSVGTTCYQTENAASVYILKI